MNLAPFLVLIINTGSINDSPNDHTAQARHFASSCKHWLYAYH